MKTLRTVIFWTHLVAGVAAGVVVLIMSITGVALTYEKQMLEWADRRAWSAPPPVGVRHLPPETLLAQVAAARPGAAPTGVTLRAHPAAPATITLEGNASLLVNPYTGAIIGQPPAALRSFFRTMTAWHRYLALDGASRTMGKAITGAANLTFLFIVISGLYLWWPRVRTWLQFRNVLWFRRGLPSKARDFNWHNVIGFWSAVPLAIVVAGAVPISYPWASNLVYRLAGEQPPVPGGGSARPSGNPEPVSGSGLNAAWQRAQEQTPEWRTIAVRLSAADRPLTLTVDEGYGGQPQQRETLTISRATGDITRVDAFADLSPGRRVRSWLRFTHTGEFYGLAGQTVAGLVSAGGVLLVYTGLALAWRRLVSWIGRRGQREAVEPARAA